VGHCPVRDLSDRFDRDDQGDGDVRERCALLRQERSEPALDRRDRHIRESICEEHAREAVTARRPLVSLGTYMPEALKNGRRRFRHAPRICRGPNTCPRITEHHCDDSQIVTGLDSQIVTRLDSQIVTVPRFLRRHRPRFPKGHRLPHLITKRSRRLSLSLTKLKGCNDKSVLRKRIAGSARDP